MSDTTVSNVKYMITRPVQDVDDTYQKFKVYNSIKEALLDNTYDTDVTNKAYGCLFNIFEQALLDKPEITLDIEDSDFEDARYEVLSIVKESSVKFDQDLKKMVLQTKLTSQDLAYLYFQILENSSESFDIVDWQVDDIYREIHDELFLGQDLHDVVEESDLSVEDTLEALYLNRGKTAPPRPGKGHVYLAVITCENSHTQDDNCVYFCYDQHNKGARNMAKVKIVQSGYNHDNDSNISISTKIYRFDVGQEYRSDQLTADEGELKKIRARANKLKRNIEVDGDEESIIMGCWTDVDSSDDDSDDDDDDDDSELEPSGNLLARESDSGLSTPS